MEFEQVLQVRRSIRAFKDEPVDPAVIESLVEALGWAPSPLNLQPWEVLVVTDPDIKAKVRQVSEAAKTAVAEQDGPGWAAKYGMDFITQAPALICVFFNPEKNGLGKYFNQPHGALCAAAAGIQNLMLAATAKGLGTVWFSFYDPGKMAQALGAPEGLASVGVIPVGVPDEQPKAPPRKPVKVHMNTF